jgi:hypothetical protein
LSYQRIITSSYDRIIVWTQEPGASANHKFACSPISLGLLPFAVYEDFRPTTTEAHSKPISQEGHYIVWIRASLLGVLVLSTGDISLKLSSHYPPSIRLPLLTPFLYHPRTQEAKGKTHARRIPALNHHPTRLPETRRDCINSVLRMNSTQCLFHFLTCTTHRRKGSSGSSVPGNLTPTFVIHYCLFCTCPGIPHRLRKALWVLRCV